MLAAVMALGLVSCGDVDESSSKKSRSAGEEKESCSVSQSSEAEIPAEESSDESSQEEIIIPDVPLYDGGFKLVDTLIGMDTETARTLIKELFPDANESENERVPNEVMKRYDYEGSLRLFGSEYECIYLLTDEKDGSTIEGVGIVYGFDRGKDALLIESDVRERYDAFMITLKNKYAGEKTDVTKTDNETVETVYWEEPKILATLTIDENSDPRAVIKTYGCFKAEFGKKIGEYTKALQKKPGTPELSEPDTMLDVKESLELCKKVFGAGKEGYQKTIEDALGITLDSTLYGNAVRREENKHSEAFMTDMLAQSFSGSVLGVFGEKFTSIRYDYNADTEETLGIDLYYSMIDYIVSEEVYKSAEDCAEAYSSILPKLVEVLGEPDSSDNGGNPSFDWENSRWVNTEYGFDVELTIEKDIRTELSPGAQELGFYNNVILSVYKHEDK